MTVQWDRGGEDTGARVGFHNLDDSTGFEVVDLVERRRYALHTPTRVTLRDADTDRFAVPLDRAVSLRTDRLDMPTFEATLVRDEDGRVLASATYDETERVSPGRHTVDISAPIKLYLLVDGPVRLASAGDSLTIGFGSPRRVLVGARSYHARPAGTVTTTGAPADMMAAVSTFGSALKTTSPERSFPTLRGHPPAVELGDSLSVPAGIDPPDTGVRLALPADRSFVYAAAPVAYYLGATLERAETPELVTDDGFEYPLPGDARGFEAAVGRVLRQTFLLDCAVRTEGLYPVDLRERSVLDDRLDRDLGALYDRSLADRLAAYLAVPWETVADLAPTWWLVASVASDPATAEVLPSFVADLALVRSARTVPPEESEAGRVFLGERRFGGREGKTAVDDPTAEGPSTPGSSADHPGDGPAELDGIIVPESVDASAHAWAAGGIPVGAAKAVPAAYRNGLDRPPREGDIELAVVATDVGSAERRQVERVYGSRDDLPFAVTVHHRPTTAELRAVLASGADLVHVVGHVGPDGIECTDGALDATALDDVTVDAFVLNACRSFEQGTALVEAGAVAGVVTAGDVVDENAVETGYTVARLLNAGFPLGSAAAIVRERSPVGAKYLVVGDPAASMVQTESGQPTVIRVDRRDDGFEVVIDIHPTRWADMGSIHASHLDGGQTLTLGSGRRPPERVSRSELRRFLSLADLPVVIDGDLRWSNRLAADGLAPADGS